MQQVIQDRAYNNVKSLIQTNIDNPNLSPEIITEFLYHYNNVEKDNAIYTYDTVIHLYQQTLVTRIRNFVINQLKIAGVAFLAAIALAGIGIFCKKYTAPNSLLNRYVEYIVPAGLITIFVGSAVVMAIKH